MNKKAILLGVLLVIGLIIVLLLAHKEVKEIDENELYSRQFGNTILKFEKYDYALGQNIIVGVEKSIDKGKNYTKVTEEPITVSSEAKFKFLNESLGFVISTGYILRSNKFKGLKVTQDGGKTFVDAKFNYENNLIDFVTIEGFPYYKNDELLLKCSIYDIHYEEYTYEDVELIFKSQDDGLTWNYQK